MTTDLDLREQIAMRIAAIRSEAFGSVFVEENERFDEDWQREMPYAPDALYFIVGPVPVLGTTAILRDGLGSHLEPRFVVDEP